MIDSEFDREIVLRYCRAMNLPVPTMEAEKPALWLVIGEYKYDAANGNGVYVRVFTTEAGAEKHCLWLRSVAEKATSSLDDWCDYNFVVLGTEEED